VNKHNSLVTLALSVSLIGGAVGASGCGGGPCGLTINKLEGSVSELYDIEVDAVRTRYVDANAIAVEYKHGNDFVTKVVADVTTFAKGAEIPLSNGTVKRITSPETNFPTSIELGTITFDSELRAGSDCIGCFNVLFNMPDGSQRTLGGAFQATLEGLPE
jgi:hypothetical protein